MTSNPYNLPLPGEISFKALEKRLDGDWAIGADTHFPYYNLTMLTELIGVMRRFNVRNLFLAGDIFDFGYLSRYEEIYEVVAQGSENMTSDLKFGREMMSALLAEVNCLVLGNGSHDRRLQQALRNRISVQALFSLFIPDHLKDRVYVPALPYAYIDTPRGPYRVTHPGAYSQVPLVVPNALANKYQCGVISAHSHYLAVGMSTSGQYVIAETGGLYDKDKVGYIHVSGDRRNPAWSNGFVLLREGRVQPYGDSIGF